jgi:hypothetical protein
MIIKKTRRGQEFSHEITEEAITEILAAAAIDLQTAEDDKTKRLINAVIDITLALDALYSLTQELINEKGQQQTAGNDQAKEPVQSGASQEASTEASACGSQDCCISNPTEQCSKKKTGRRPRKTKAAGGK